MNALDITLTLHGLSLGATEMNPLFNPNHSFFKLMAPVALMMVWAPAYRYCNLLISKGRSEFGAGKKVLENMLLFLVALYFAVVVNNLVVVFAVC